MIHECSRATCGAPRIHAELAAEGMRIGRKTHGAPAESHGTSRRKPAQMDNHHGARSRGAARSRLGRTQLRRGGAESFVAR
jgi:hypothetical protein